MGSAQGKGAEEGIHSPPPDLNPFSDSLVDYVDLCAHDLVVYCTIDELHIKFLISFSSSCSSSSLSPSLPPSLSLSCLLHFFFAVFRSPACDCVMLIRTSSSPRTLVAFFLMELRSA
eukprot:761508-Hanusia_phi.AAC.12